jgi:uncharacterized DUF497 family protein
MYILNSEFEWDEEKAAQNLEKHGVSFEEAMSCFYDPEIVMGHDLSHSKGEDRYVGMAKSNAGRILVFVFTMRRKQDGQEVFRIISSRTASKKERKNYPR